MEVQRRWFSASWRRANSSALSSLGLVWAEGWGKRSNWYQWRHFQPSLRGWNELRMKRLTWNATFHNQLNSAFLCYQSLFWKWCSRPTGSSGCWEKEECCVFLFPCPHVHFVSESVFGLLAKLMCTLHFWTFSRTVTVGAGMLCQIMAFLESEALAFFSK